MRHWRRVRVSLFSFAILQAALNGASLQNGNAAEQRPSATRATATVATKSTEAQKPNKMTWAGAQTAGNDWAVYTGSSYGLSGALDGGGWRLRAIGGYGRYSYRGSRLIAGRRQAIEFSGQTHFADVLVGRQWRAGDLTLKAFAGIASVTNTVTPFDTDNAALGDRYGGKAVLEAWFDLTSQTWLSGDVNYSTVFNSFNATVRGGYRLQPFLSLGLESGIVGNNDFIAGRAALLGAFELGIFRANDSYLRISAGVSADRDIDLKPYASISLSVKY